MTRLIRLAVTTLALAVSAGCGTSGGANEAASPPSTSSSALVAVRIVAIGDSDATGAGDSTGKGWVGRYGELVKQKLHVPVTVDNLAAEGQTSSMLRANITGDDTLRQAIRTANVVLIGMGGADLNAGDAALSAGRCKGRACYAPVIRTFAANIDAIATEVRHLAPTALLRTTGMPNGFPGAGNAFPPFATADLNRYQAEAISAAVCQAMRTNNGQCVDVLRAFNGAKATATAYSAGLMTKNPCCYPSSTGQQLIAQLLIDTGLPKLHRTQ